MSRFEWDRRQSNTVTPRVFMRGKNRWTRGRQMWECQSRLFLFWAELLQCHHLLSHHLFLHPHQWVLNSFLKKLRFFLFFSFVFSAQRGEGLKSDPPKVQHPPSRTMTYSICSPSHHTMLRVLICDLPKARHQASLSLKKDWPYNSAPCWLHHYRSLTRSWPTSTKAFLDTQRWMLPYTP